MSAATVDPWRTCHAQHELGPVSVIIRRAADEKSTSVKHPTDNTTSQTLSCCHSTLPVADPGSLGIRADTAIAELKPNAPMDVVRQMTQDVVSTSGLAEHPDSHGLHLGLANEHLDSDDPSLTSNRPKAYLIVKGGGVKGLAAAAAIEVVEQHVDLLGFYGTSAGAIAAVLLGAGYSGSELVSQLKQKDLSEFLDRPWLRRWANLFIRGGLNSGRPLEDWVSELVHRRFSKRTPVELAEIGSSKRVVVFASTERHGTVRFDSHGQNKNTAVEFAVRCSISIPYVFWPVTFENEEISDGGLLNNFPIERYLEDNGDSDFVGIYLSSSARRATSSRFRPLRILNILLGRDEDALVDRYRNKIVVIRTDPIGPIQFNLSELEKSFLISAGKAAALEYLATHRQIKFDGRTVQGAVEEVNALRQRVLSVKARRRSRILALVFSLLIALTLVAWPRRENTGSGTETANATPNIRRDAPIRVDDLKVLRQLAASDHYSEVVVTSGDEAAREGVRIEPDQHKITNINRYLISLNSWEGRATVTPTQVTYGLFMRYFQSMNPTRFQFEIAVPPYQKTNPLEEMIGEGFAEPRTFGYLSPWPISSVAFDLSETGEFGLLELRLYIRKD